MATFSEAVEHLRGVYGDNPQLVGIEDGTEDDYGDLLSESALLLDIDIESDDRWQRWQDAAQRNEHTDMEAWLTEMQRVG